MTTDADYMREWREKNPDRHQKHKRRQYVRDRALRVLGRRHPNELDQIMEKMNGSRRRG